MTDTWCDLTDDVVREIAIRGRMMRWPPVGPRLHDGREPSQSMIRRRMKTLGVYDDWRRQVASGHVSKTESHT